LTGLAAAQAEVRAVALELAALRSRLSRLQEGIPPSPAETSLEDLDQDPDVATELRAVLGHVVRGGLDPLIRDLTDAAAYEPTAAGGRDLSLEEEVVTFDLEIDNEPTRRALYALAVRDNFTAIQSDDYPRRDVILPRYSAKEAGLQVARLGGRWFATWVKLEMPEDAPSRERHEILLLEEETPGHITYREIGSSWRPDAERTPGRPR